MQTRNKKGNGGAKKRRNYKRHKGKKTLKGDDEKTLAPKKKKGRAGLGP